jgi:hypothetical protein
MAEGLVKDHSVAYRAHSARVEVPDPPKYHGWARSAENVVAILCVVMLLATENAEQLDRRRVVQFKAEIFNHAVRVRRLLPRGCQIAIDENRIGRVKTQRL